jgi:trigger factor
MTETHEDLKSTVKNLSSVRRELEIELSAAEAAKTYDEMVQEFSGRAKLPGFRPGKAPVAVVLKKFGHDIEHEVVDHLIPEVLHRALQLNGIRAVGVPSVENVSFEAGAPLKFKAVVETWPEFELPAYLGLKLKKRDPVVGEDEIDKTIEDLRRKQAEYIPVEGRGIQNGDYVVALVQGRDLKTKRLLPAEKAVVLVGHERNDPALNEHLLGLRAAEEKAFEYAYPPDFANKKFAGKTIAYTMKVQTVKEMIFPEVNDELAKHLGEFETLDALRAKIREELTVTKAQYVRRETSQEAVQTVIGQAKIELPETVVEEEMESVLKNIASQLPRQGISREAAETIRARAREQAEQNLKEHLVIRKIAQAEGFDVTEPDIDEEIKSIAAATGLPLARVMDTFQEEGRREGLKSTLLARRTVDFLISRAIME